jgi:hypothetical protein
MKKLLLMCLLPIMVLAQHKEIDRYVSGTVSIDGMNIAKGSQATNDKKEFDIKANFTINLCHNITFGVEFESFKAIGYSELSWGAGYIFEPTERLRVHVDLQTELIFRRGEMVEVYFQHEDQFIGASINAKVGYELFPKWLPNVYFGEQFGAQLRGDLLAAGYTKFKDFVKGNRSFTVEYVIYID